MMNSGLVLPACGLLYGLNRLSYDLLKQRILNSRSWDLNVCCGRADCGKVNTDIVIHADVRFLTGG